MGLGQQDNSDVADRTGLIAAALPMPVLLIGPHLEILYVNPAAEQFFDMGAGLLVRQRLQDITPFASPLIQVIAQARERHSSISEHDVDLTTPRHGERLTDVIVTPVANPDGAVLVTLQERGFAQRLDRQLSHRGAVRSLHGMAAVLAQEIKNPLAGIRGAAQLLEEAMPDSEKELTQLICAESDRICALIDRMEAFGDTRALPRIPVNIHEVLGRVRMVAETSFAKHVTFAEMFDPSLPAVLGDRDQLIQVFMNLVRNAKRSR
jgi:two-component system nitrogen regulation sensor histidine kinase GlnL